MYRLILTDLLSKAIRRQRCKIWSNLVLITNRKSHMSFQLVQKSLSLNDLEWRNGQTLAKIWRFFDFSRRRPPPSWIFKFWKLRFSNFGNFNGRNAYGQTASMCQILSKSAKLRPRYGDFSIFQDGGHCHLGFPNFVNFNKRKAQDGQTASPCQISSRYQSYVKTGNIALSLS